jgi:hypothetical protein
MLSCQAAKSLSRLVEKKYGDGAQSKEVTRWGGIRGCGRKSKGLEEGKIKEDIKIKEAEKEKPGE